MSVDLAVFTFIHVVISLVGIATGAIVVLGLVTARRLDGWTAVFLGTTIATSVTGFGFPADRFLPSHTIGLISMVVLAAAVYARYRRHLSNVWRLVYVVGAVIALYLNVFVLIVQAFLKVPALKVLAPTQSEPPFQIAQLATLLLFVMLGILAVVRFRLGTERSVARAQPQTHAAVS